MASKTTILQSKSAGTISLSLRKIVRGGADDSYGIEGRRARRRPERCHQACKRILADLETEAPRIEVRAIDEPESAQVSMLDLGTNAVAERLRAMQIETMTPIEAMTALYELKQMLS